MAQSVGRAAPTILLRQVRAGLAALGLRSLDQLVGRADLLKQRDIKLAKTSALDLSFVTTYAGETGKSSDRRKQCAPHLAPIALLPSLRLRHLVPACIVLSCRHTTHGCCGLLITMSGTRDLCVHLLVCPSSPPYCRSCYQHDLAVLSLGHVPLCNRAVHGNGPVWDDDILDDVRLTEAIKNSGSFKYDGNITNVQV